MRLYVGNLPSGADAQELVDEIRDLLCAFGSITTVTVKGRFGFVDFSDEDNRVDDAVDQLNGQTVRGEVVSIEHCRSDYDPNPPATCVSVHVSGLAPQVTWQQLENEVQTVVNPTKTTIHTNDSTSVGWVTFSNTTDAQACFKALNGRSMDGCILAAYLVDTSPPAKKDRRPRNESADAAPEDNKIPFRCMVPNKLVGAIIGKGGAVIREISESTGTRVEIQRREEASAPRDRVVTITGDVEDINRAYAMVAKLLQADAVKNNPEADVDSAVPLQLLVPNEIVGHLIGKAGAHIRQVQVDSGAKLQISPREEAKFTSQRLITVTGSVDEVCAAQVLILERIASVITTQNGDPNPRFNGPVQGLFMMPEQPEETVHFEVPNSAVGAIIGKGGNNIKDIMRQSGANVRILKADEDAVDGDDEVITRTIVVTGPGDCQTKAQQLIYLRTQEALSAYGNPVDSSITMELFVKSSLVGRVIGKGGAKIREIMQLSGADVQIPASEEATDETVITVVGAFSQCQGAQGLIREVIASHRMRDTA